MALELVTETLRFDLRQLVPFIYNLIKSRHLKMLLQRLPIIQVIFYISHKYQLQCNSLLADLNV